MSTADKLTYLNGTKAALRKAINDAGGYLTVDDTFRSYTGEWLREKSATLSLDFWCERFITRRQGSLTPFAIGQGIVNFTRSTAGGRFNEYGLYVNAAIDAWRLDHDPASLTTSTSTVSFDSSVASFELPSGHAFFVGDLFRATAIAGSLWGVVMARSDTSVVVHVHNSNATGSASSWTCIKPLGLLIEESRTNLLLRSSEFANAYWSKVDVTITSNALMAPDGTMAACKLVGTGASSNKFVFRTVAGITAQQYTATCFYKRAEHRYAFVQLFSGPFFAQARVIVDLDTGLVTQTIGGAVASVRDCGDGWYRIAVTATASSNGNGIAYFGGTPLPNTYQYTGDGGGVYAWGAQLEVGAFPTSAMPTEASQVTRAADVASVNTLSPWYNASEGTLFVDYISGPSGAGIVTQFDDGSQTNRTEVTTSAGAIRLINTVGGVQDANIFITSPPSANTPYKIAAAMKDNDFAAVANGGTVGSDNSVTVVSKTRLLIGSRAGLFATNGHIRSLRYWPKRDMPIQEMTA